MLFTNMNLDYYKDLPTLVNENIEKELIKRTEKTLYELIKENSNNVNNITQKLLNLELNKMIAKLNHDANVKSFDIKLIYVYLEDTFIENEPTDLNNKIYLYCQNINPLPLVFIKYLINNSNMLYDNRINDKVLAYRNSLGNIYNIKENNKNEEM